MTDDRLKMIRRRRIEALRRAVADAAELRPDPRPSHDPTALYRLFDASYRLLYVGITRSPRSRFDAHGSEQPWWPVVAGATIEWFTSRHEALTAERQAIADENPIYNKARPPTDREATWRWLCTHEPRLLPLERGVRETEVKVRAPLYCQTDWWEGIRAGVRPLLGIGRGDERAGLLDVSAAMESMFDDLITSCEVPHDVELTLRRGDLHDFAMDYLYALLPSCQPCERCYSGEVRPQWRVSAA